MEPTLQKGHEDHIAAKGENSMNHENLIHKFIPHAVSDENSGLKRQQWKKWKKFAIQAWKLNKVKSKKEVLLEAQRNKNKVHFASLVDLCHLKNAELEPTFHYKGRVVLRGDTIEDDSGACAVCTEQGSSASQMTAKVMDVIARLPDCDKQPTQ